MKSKKILTILLSLAIMFTFMPAMAFAYTTNNGTYDWGDNFKSVQVKNAAGVVTKTYNDVRYSVAADGKITAKAYEDGNPVSPAIQASFYDLNNAVLLNGTTEVKGEWKYNTYKGLYSSSSLHLQLAKPEYITTAQWAAVNTYAAFDSMTSIKTVGTYAEKANKGDTETIDTTVYRTAVADGDTYAFILGTSPSATVTISDGNTGSANGWYLDTVSSTTGITNDKARYDGKEHTIVYNANDAAGAITYQKYDNTKGEWKDGGALTFKDAGSYGMWRVSYKTTSGTTYESPALGLNSTPIPYVVIAPVDTSKYNPAFSFKASAPRTSTVKWDYDLTAEQAANPVSFVQVTANTAFAADEAELMNYFNDFYQVDVAKDATNANLQSWTISAKKLTDAEKLELNKKYKTLLVNYGKATLNDDGTFNGEVGSFLGVDAVGKVARIAGSSELNTKDDDITFSGVTKKTYKAKKSTKKLAKTKSFTVSAVADSGNAVTFTATSTSSKIKINKTTGKVTVKKGLKKGTYKITVKAKTAAGNGYKACKESKTYTIKVK